MTKIDRKLFIGDGTERDCFIHPERPDLCLKISRPGTGTKQHDNDVRLYAKLAKRGTDVWRHIARFVGTVETDAGEALLFETVRDEGGAVSKSLLHYLRNDPDAIDEAMFEALKRLERFLFRHHIILKDPSPSNLLYRRDEEGRGEFVIIDGIGPSLPNMGPLNRLVEMKVARQWRKVIDRMRKETADHPVLPEKINRYWREASK